MKAWLVGRAGPPDDVMELGERPPPEPIPGELRIRVQAAGVGLPDVLMCRRRYVFEPPVPFTPGQEAVGVVTHAGAQSEFETGQRVMGVTVFYRGYGAFAEEALLVADATSAVPASMPDDEAAVFSIPFRTAYIALAVRAQLAAGETLLVHGAAGGAGFAAVQLGKALGARVIAVARGTEKLAGCREDGADDCVDAAEGDFVDAVKELTNGRGADVVFDPVGGETFRRSLGCTAYNGRLLAIGFASGAWGQIPTLELVNRNCSVLGVVAVPRDAEAGARMVRELAAYYEAKQIRPRIAKTLGFAEVPRALVDLEARRISGKQVIRIATGD